MMLEITKPLKRIRGHKETEEGEVEEDTDEEEDGEMKEEHGDDVVINIKGCLCTPNFAIFFLINFAFYFVKQLWCNGFW